MKKLKLYKIHWFDASSEDRWTPIQKIQEARVVPVSCVSTGYVISKNKKMLVLSSTIDTTNWNTCCAIYIPRCSITKMERVK